METPDRIVGGNVRSGAMTQAGQNFRVSVTHATARRTILPLKMTSACYSAPKTRRHAKSTIGSVAAAARWDATLSVPTIALTHPLGHRSLDEIPSKLQSNLKMAARQGRCASCIFAGTRPQYATVGAYNQGSRDGPIVNGD
ncbi:MAG: hypothetical protein JWR09_5880 [Mucilaginibacter sp.]|jgi:hypothetical protein|nr:hypothetical protein [Mucilaginibacter sp.]